MNIIFRITAIVCCVMAVIYALYLVAMFSAPVIGEIHYNWCGMIDYAKPLTTYGEFPFTVKYSYNGEIKTAEDVMECRFYDSFYDMAFGVWYEWDVTFAGGYGSHYPIEEGIYLYVASEKWLMGDKDAKNEEAYLYIPDEYGGRSKINGEDHGIELISVEIAEPIENYFPTDGKVIALGFEGFAWK